MDWQKITAELQKPLDPSAIKPPAPGKFGDYVDGYHVLTEANRIFGFDGQFGELKAGAAGDVVVWSGDPLEPLSQPSAVLIDGVEQPLQARNLLLRDRYRTGGEGAMPPAYGD